MDLRFIFGLAYLLAGSLTSKDAEKTHKAAGIENNRRDQNRGNIARTARVEYVRKNRQPVKPTRVGPLIRR